RHRICLVGAAETAPTGITTRPPMDYGVAAPPPCSSAGGWAGAGAGDSSAGCAAGTGTSVAGRVPGGVPGTGAAGASVSVAGATPGAAAAAGAGAGAGAAPLATRTPRDSIHALNSSAVMRLPFWLMSKRQGVLSNSVLGL